MFMDTISEAKEHCRYVAQGVIEAVANGEDLTGYFEGVQNVRFLVDRGADGKVSVVGGVIEADDSGIEISDRGVFKQYGDEYVGVAFDPETRAAFIEFFGMLYWA